MRRSVLLLIGLLAVVGCEDDDDDIRHRTVFVEVTSSPSGLLMSVWVGVEDAVYFEAPTPIARNVRAGVPCRNATSTAVDECVVFASASVKDDDPAGKRVTMCLTDAGEQDCATSNEGAVSVSMTIRP